MTNLDSFPHRDKAREWMKFDALQTAYDIVGEGGIDTEAEQMAIGGLGMVLMHHALEQKKMYLSEMGDTYYRMPWQDAVEIIEKLGFSITKTMDEASKYGGIYRHLTAETADKKMILTANGSQNYETKSWQLDYNTMIYAVVDTHGDFGAWSDLFKLGASSHPLGDVNDTTDHRFAMSWAVTDGLEMILDGIRQSTADCIDWPDDEWLAHIFPTKP